MQVGFMVTNGGPHSHDKWGEMTADQLIKVEDSAPEELRQAGNLLKMKLASVLATNHMEVQAHERTKLNESNTRVSAPLHPEKDNVEKAVADVIAAADGTPFEGHFAQPDVKDYVSRVVTQHFQTSMDVDRSWHADRNPDCPHCDAYKKVRGEYGMHNVAAVMSARS